MSSKVESLFLKCETSNIKKTAEYLSSVTEYFTNELENKIKSEDLNLF